jgi:branched-chain amino acid transport system ATP-binding protein
LLSLEGVEAGYGDLRVLHNCNLEVGEAEVVALLGANGAGKTTMLRTIVGLLRPADGDIRLEGRSIVGLGPHDLVKRGVVMVPEDKELFGGLSVRENLVMGAYTRSAAERQEAMGEVHELFPILRERTNQNTDTLSGGEQQMLALGRALMARPRILLLDEPSVGLAPILVSEVLTIVERINEELGITVLLVEQNVQQTLKLADRAYVIESGEIALSGTGAELLADPAVRKAYLGL